MLRGRPSRSVRAGRPRRRRGLTTAAPGCHGDTHACGADAGEARGDEAARNGQGAAARWLEQPKDKDLAPADLLGLLADAERLHRENKKLTARLKNAQAASSRPASRTSTTRTPEACPRRWCWTWPPRRWVHEPPERPAHRPHRRRQELPGVRAGAEGLPGRLLRRVPPRLAALRRAGPGSRRRHLSPRCCAGSPRPRSSSSTTSAWSPWAPPSARSCSKCSRIATARLHRRHQPTGAQGLARRHRRRHPG